MITKIGMFESIRSRIKPGWPGYNPDVSHYDREGNWVGDATATEAGNHWKARAESVKKSKLYDPEVNEEMTNAFLQDIGYDTSKLTEHTRRNAQMAAHKAALVNQIYKQETGNYRDPVPNLMRVLESRGITIPH